MKKIIALSVAIIFTGWALYFSIVNNPLIMNSIEKLGVTKIFSLAGIVIVLMVMSYSYFSRRIDQSHEENMASLHHIADQENKKDKTKSKFQTVYNLINGITYKFDSGVWRDSTGESLTLNTTTEDHSLGYCIAIKSGHVYLSAGLAQYFFTIPSDFQVSEFEMIGAVIFLLWGDIKNLPLRDKPSNLWCQFHCSNNCKPIKFRKKNIDFAHLLEVINNKQINPSILN